MAETDVQPQGSGNENKHDWGLFVGGLVMAAIGFVVFMLPAEGLVVFAIVAGAVLLVSGILNIIGWIRRHKEMESSAWVLIMGICDLVLGAMFLIHPLVAAAVIPQLAGIFILIYGIIAVIAAISMHKYSSSWGLMLVNGIISILCAVLFIAIPVSAAIFLGLFLFVRGIMMMVCGLTVPKLTPYM